MINGKWRKEPFPLREYERLYDYIPTDTVGKEESDRLVSLLNTPLQGFLGPAYNYDDQSLTEEWMVSFQDASSKKKAPTGDDVIRTQVDSLLEILKVIFTFIFFIVFIFVFLYFFH